MTTETAVLDYVNLGAFRSCRHGRGVAYVAHMETAGPMAVRAAIDAAERAGMLCVPGCVDPAHRSAPVLDLLDADGDNVGDRCIPTPTAWAWWVQAVELRATSSDCEACEPAAHAAIYGGG